MSNNRVKIRLERALCTLDAPLFDGEITYNRFSLPKGCTYEGKSLDNMYFYPYVASYIVLFCTPLKIAFLAVIPFV